jgi:hypothetical protein
MLLQTTTDRQIRNLQKRYTKFKTHLSVTGGNHPTINLLPGRTQHGTWRKQDPLKRWYPSTKPYDVMPRRPCKELEKM